MAIPASSKMMSRFHWRNTQRIPIAVLARSDFAHPPSPRLFLSFERLRRENKIELEQEEVWPVSQLVERASVRNSLASRKPISAARKSARIAFAAWPSRSAADTTGSSRQSLPASAAWQHPVSNHSSPDREGRPAYKLSAPGIGRGPFRVGKVAKG